MSENTNVVVAEETLTDAQASKQLQVLFATYLSLKKSKPKLKGEAALLPGMYAGTLCIDTLFETLRADFDVWSEKLLAVVEAIAGVGASNPSANIKLLDKDGTFIHVNGERLKSALLREDARILRAKPI